MQTLRQIGCCIKNTLHPPSSDLNADQPFAINPPCLIVVGGTSGIGLALALKHQALGWQVVVVGSRLSKIETLQQQHPTLIIHQCDLSDPLQRLALLKQLDAYPVNRLIYCAGWYLNERTSELNRVASARMLAVNLQAFHEVFAWASTQLQQLCDANAEPQQTSFGPLPPPSLICLASIAGVIEYPYASVYAKCKRAMIVSASAYRMALAPFGIHVNCVALGYVNTQTLRELNEGDASHKPFIMQEDAAIAHILNAINNNVELTIAPRQMRYLAKLMNRLPKTVLNHIMRHKLDVKTTT